ncbi:Uncharacterised protein [Clostridium paraputrificum]|nr:Uncharacterised protein [Clostridium paraputrificum]
MRFMGRIFELCAIAESRPASMHSLRNTELSTWRAAGFRPKEMFDRPRVVWTSGWRFFSSRMASMVSMPSRRVSSWPVEMGNVRQSTMMSCSRRPHVPVMSAMSRSAISTFFSRVRAWPSSSMASATTVAPCSTASSMMRW